MLGIPVCIAIYIESDRCTLLYIVWLLTIFNAVCRWWGSLLVVYYRCVYEYRCSNHGNNTMDHNWTWDAAAAACQHMHILYTHLTHMTLDETVGLDDGNVFSYLIMLTKFQNYVKKNDVKNGWRNARQRKT